MKNINLKILDSDWSKALKHYSFIIFLCYFKFYLWIRRKYPKRAKQAGDPDNFDQVHAAFGDNLNIISIFKKEEGKEDNYELKFELWKDFFFFQDNREIRKELYEAKQKNILTRKDIALPMIPFKLSTIQPNCS